jgi:hypothetical protein
MTDYEWREVLPISETVAPTKSESFPMTIRLSDASSETRPSMHLSISTTRRTVRNRKMVVPIIVPAHIPKASS